MTESMIFTEIAFLVKMPSDTKFVQEFQEQ